MTDSSKTIDRWVTVVLLVVTIAYLVGMFQYPFKAYVVPVIVAAATLAAGVAQLWGQLRPQEDDIEEADTAGTGDLGRLGREGLSRLGLILGWTTGVVVAILVFGFVIGPALMAVALMRVERETWVATVLVTGVLAGITFLLMSVILRLPILDGLLWDWVS